MHTFIIFCRRIFVAVFTCEKVLFWHTRSHRWIFVLLSLCVYIHKRMNPNIDAYDSSFVALVSLSATLTGSRIASSSSRKISALLGCFVVLVSVLGLGVEKGGNWTRNIKKKRKKRKICFLKSCQSFKWLLILDVDCPKVHALLHNPEKARDSCRARLHFVFRNPHDATFHLSSA